MSYLRQVAAADVQKFPTVGLGKTLRLQANGTVGVGLWTEEALVHLAAFRVDRNGSETPLDPRSSIRRASQRFRF